jgi:hypothetical protein
MSFLGRRRQKSRHDERAGAPGPRRLVVHAEPVIARDDMVVLADAEVAYTVAEGSRVSAPPDTDAAVEELVVTILRNLAALQDHEDLLTSSWTSADELASTLRLAVPTWRVTIDEVRVVLRPYAAEHESSRRVVR